MPSDHSREPRRWWCLQLQKRWSRSPAPSLQTTNPQFGDKLCMNNTYSTTGACISSPSCQVDEKILIINAYSTYFGSQKHSFAKVLLPKSHFEASSSGTLKVSPCWHRTLANSRYAAAAQAAAANATALLGDPEKFDLKFCPVKWCRLPPFLHQPSKYDMGSFSLEVSFLSLMNKNGWLKATSKCFD